MRFKIAILLKTQGFTLIELLISIAVISIISTIGIVSFAQYSRSQAVKAVASDVANVIETVKAKASSQTIQAGTTCEGFEGYIFTINEAAKTYTYNLVCDQSSAPPPPPPFPKTLPSDVKFGSPVETTSIFFNALTNGVIFNGDPVIPSGGITISNNNNSIRMCLNINSIGAITQKSC